MASGRRHKSEPVRFGRRVAASVLAAALLGVALVALPRGHGEVPAAAEDAGDPHVIVAVGDLVCAGVGQGAVQPRESSRSANACRSDLVADLIDEIDPDRFLPLGDLYYDKPSLDRLMRTYDVQFGHLKEISSPAIGNHEYDVAGAQGYFEYFEDYLDEVDATDDGYYAFRLGDWLLIALNTPICISGDDCAPGTPQYTFLEETLEANNDAGCVLAYGHHPRYDWRPWQKFIRDDEGQVRIAPLYDHKAEVREAEPLAPLWARATSSTTTRRTWCSRRTTTNTSAGHRWMPTGTR
jgi:hypothetical protein